jgi:hypothetical protein
MSTASREDGEAEVVVSSCTGKVTLSKRPGSVNRPNGVGAVFRRAGWAAYRIVIVSPKNRSDP